MIGATKGTLDVALLLWPVSCSRLSTACVGVAPCPESGRQLAQAFRFADNVRTKMHFDSCHYKTMTNETAQIDHQIYQNGD
jgi:hypothetical protein